MSERELQAEIIEPLLRKLGFRNVQDTSGPEEYGKDLIATKSDEFGHTMLYAVQIKKFKPSAKVASSTSFGHLLDQLRQAIEEVVIDPTTNEQRSPDWCLFITPYPIPAPVRKAFHQRMKDPIFRSLRIVDGPMLIEQIQTYMPEALSRFSMETQYRLQVGQYTNKILESSIAFGLSEGLELDNIYVDVVLWQRDSLLEILAAFHERRTKATEETTKPKAAEEKPIKMVKVAATVEEVEELITYYNKWPEFSPEIFKRSLEKAKPEIRRVLNEKTGIMEEKTRYVTTIESNSIFDPASNKVQQYINLIPKISAPETSVEECTQIAHEGIQLRRDLQYFQKLALVRRHWDSLLGTASMIPAQRISHSIVATSLLKINKCLYITGGPGSGKTTLLRRLSQTIARTQKNQLPLYLPLITVDDPSYEGLIQACLNELNSRGYGAPGRYLSAKSFRSLLTKGKFRLCLDGLDEAGGKAEKLMAAIDVLASKHPKCNVILSSRDTFGFDSWTRAYSIGLEPFSTKQLELFIEKWFSSEPSSKYELISWLSDNNKMRLSAQTPLIAALLCSLFQLKADMPSTEIDLYERRFELLLGKWDQAKGIQPLRTEIRKRYLHYLMAFAFYLHSIEKRSATHKEAVTFASKYYSEQFHRTPEAMVQDCVKRGVFEYEQGGNLSLGHLTYQEYLAAEWLSQHNPIQFIWSRILTPWWNKTLEFYAARKLDITPLVRFGLRYCGESSSMESIWKLSKLAPLTSETVINKFRSLPRTGLLPQYNWQALPSPPSSI